MTANDIITRARETLFDTTEPYRWSNEEFLRWLTDGLRELWVRRPDAFYVTAIVTTPPAAVTLTAASVPALDAFTQPLADYLCFRAFMRDSDDAASANRAQLHLKLFAAEIS